jgi:broad specificity phosphatase PhoE
VTTLLLARHGETDWNRDHRWQGHEGPPLNATGRRQARDLAERVHDLDAIYSSDTIRVRETAEIVAARHGLGLHTDARLREMSFGVWEGLTRAEIERQHGEDFARWLAGGLPTPAGGEPDDAVAERVLEALLEIAASHAGERVLVVTSGGPIRAALARARGLDHAAARLLPRPENCEVVELRANEGALVDRTSAGSRSAATR